MTQQFGKDLKDRFKPGNTLVSLTKKEIAVTTSEMRIRLKFPMRNAKIVSPLAPFPPLSAALLGKSAVPHSSAKPGTLGVAQSVATADLWDSQTGKQLIADRKLIETLLARLLDSVHELQSNQQRRLSELQQAAIEIALTIATRLLHRQIIAGEFDIAAMVKDMVGQLGDDVPVTVRLNPEDLALLEKRLEGQPLFPELPNSPKLVADTSLGRGDGRVEGKATTLLSELPGQLTEIREDLMRSLGHASGT